MVSELWHLKNSAFSLWGLPLDSNEVTAWLRQSSSSRFHWFQACPLQLRFRVLILGSPDTSLCNRMLFLSLFVEEQPCSTVSDGFIDYPLLSICPDGLFC